MTKEEFGHICEKSKGELIRLARRFIKATGGPEEAEDIVQEATIVLWQLYERNYPIQNPKALAIKITKNLCASLYRKSKREAIPLGANDKSGGESASDVAETKDNQWIKETLYSHLTPARRKCMILRNDFGMSLDEIAETTGHPKESVKVLISTARKQMLEEIKELL